MKLWPAIDIREGRCVCLRQGDFDRETPYGNPVEVAEQYLSEGADRLHVVDLDAARTGEPVNRSIVLQIAHATDAVVEAGGGIRTEKDAQILLDGGVQRVVLSTAALARGGRELLERLTGRWPGRIVLGLDHRVERDHEGVARREVAVRGWTEKGGLLVDDVLESLGDLAFGDVVITDISRDGTGAGPDLSGLEDLLQRTGLPIVASGGVGSAADIVRLRSLGIKDRRLSGVIVGKALLDGHLTFEDAKLAASLGSGR